MKRLLLIAFTSILFLAGIIYLLGKTPMTPPSATPLLSPTPISSSQETLIITPVDATSLEQGGSSFRESQGLYTFLYPNDFKLDVQGDQIIRISKTGATQRGQTEMYDGIIMVFESINLNGQTLEQWVDARIAQSTQAGTADVTQPKRRMSLRTYPGFTYSVRGLGESTYLLLQKDTNSQFAVNITFLVADPEKKNYQKEVDMILSTLELLK